MKQKPMNTIAALVTAAQKSSGGAAEHAVSLGLVYTTKPLIDADINAVLLARDNHQVAKDELTRRRAAHETFLSGAISWTTVARDLTKRKLGNKHSSKWEDLGLKNSLRVPQYTDRLLAVIMQFKAFFELHPELEVPQLNITATGASSIAAELLGFKNAVNAQLTIVKTLQLVRDEKRKQLHWRMRAAIHELSCALDPDDPRWLAFGFNMPGAKAVPPAPENLIVLQAKTNSVAVKWDPTPRAEYDHVFVKVVGRDEDFNRVGSPRDPDFGFDDLPAAATVEVAITALNSGGESVKSKILTITGLRPRDSEDLVPLA
jgi:hypothetical protein